MGKKNVRSEARLNYIKKTVINYKECLKSLEEAKISTSSDMLTRSLKSIYLKTIGLQQYISFNKFRHFLDILLENGDIDKREFIVLHNLYYRNIVILINTFRPKITKKQYIWTKWYWDLTSFFNFKLEKYKIWK